MANALLLILYIQQGCYPIINILPICISVCNVSWIILHIRKGDSQIMTKFSVCTGLNRSRPYVEHRFIHGEALRFEHPFLEVILMRKGTAWFVGLNRPLVSRRSFARFIERLLGGFLFGTPVSLGTDHITLDYLRNSWGSWSSLGALSNTRRMCPE